MRIQIVPFQDSWASDFEFYHEIISDLGSGLNIKVEHIGSTAIKGMCAKPIIDILVGLPSIDKADILANALHNNSPFCYVPAYEESLPNRRFLLFLPNYNGPMIKNALDLEKIRESDSCHIHLCVEGSFFWNQHLAFKDFLNKNKKWADQYAQLKTVLSEFEFTYRAQYNLCKEPLIKTISNLALSEYSYGK